jgi:hypothetical protein
MTVTADQERSRAAAMLRHLRTERGVRLSIADEPGPDGRPQLVLEGATDALTTRDIDAITRQKDVLLGILADEWAQDQGPLLDESDDQQPATADQLATLRRLQQVVGLRLDLAGITADEAAREIETLNLWVLQWRQQQQATDAPGA